VEHDDFNSDQNILLVYDDGHIDPDIQFNITGILKNVPKSLWEKRETGYDKDAVIGDVLVGFDITPVVAPPDHSLPIERKDLQFNWQTYTPNLTYSTPTPVPGPPQTNPMQTMQDTINSAPANTMRDAILQTLVKSGIELDTQVDVADIASSAEDYLMAPPILSYTYWEKAS
jgi:hypothetical protein